MRCLSPVTIKDEIIQKYVEVPCGKCPSCLSNRRREWACRLSAELQKCASAYFITLTYDDSHRPIADDKYVLVKKDFQDFMKRLRKYMSVNVPENHDYPLKYVCVGEYGAHTYLPHFHISMFNLPWSKEHLDTVLSITWGKGLFHVGEVNSRSAMYEFKYLLKDEEQFPDPDDIRNNEFKTFMTCSKGIGLSWLDDEMKRYLRRGKPPNEYNNVILDKNSYHLPRYYRKKLHPGKLNKIEHCLVMEKQIINRQEEFNRTVDLYGDNTPSYYMTQAKFITENSKKIYQQRNKL